MLFVGEYEVVLGDNGRVVIPKKIREALGRTNTFILTKGFDSCLSGFRNEDWEKGTKELIGPSILEMKRVEMKRHLFSSSVSIEIDDQGRIVIPKNLVDYAGLTGRRVVIIGVGAHFEIWNWEKWQKYLISIKPKIKDLAKND